MCDQSFCTKKALRLHVESTHESKSRNPGNKVESVKDDSVKDDPIKDDSAKDDSVKDDSVKEDPVKDDSVKDDLVEDGSAKDDPAKDDSSKDDSAKDDPASVPSDNNLVQKRCKTCPECNKIFFNHFNVRRHLKTEHRKNERWECDKCKNSFSSRYSLDYHVKAFHEKDTLFNCRICEETFDTIAKLTKHKSSHNPEVKFNCRYCGIYFKSKSNMNRHKQEIHCKGTRQDTSKIEVLLYNFSCDQCSFVSKRKSHLMMHQKNKHNTDDTNKKLCTDDKKCCPICFKIFCNSSKVKRHILSIHEAGSSCDTKNEKNSLTPLSKESNEKIKKQCHYCDQIVLGSNMWRHIAETHNKTKYNTAVVEVSHFPHGCEVCDFKTKKKFDLKRHYKQKHSLCDVTYPCERCGKVFKYETSVKRHNKTCQENGSKV